MRCLPDVGDLVELKRFAFINKAGGTGMSDWKFDPKFEGVAKARVVKGWHDYETGERYIGVAVSEDLERYMAANANAADKRVRFGEFDLKGAG